MAVPDGFEPFPNQGPFLEHIGPIHALACTGQASRLPACAEREG